MRVGFPSFRHCIPPTTAAVPTSATLPPTTAAVPTSATLERKVFNCPLCQMLLNGPRQYKEHLVYQGEIAQMHRKNFKMFLKAFEDERIALEVTRQVHVKKQGPRSVTIGVSTMIAEHEMIYADAPLPSCLADRAAYLEGLERAQAQQRVNEGAKGSGTVGCISMAQPMC